MWKDRKVPKTRHIWGDSNWMHKACVKIETNKFIPKTQKHLKTTRSKFSQTLSFFFDFLALSASSCSSMKSHLSCQTVVGLLFLQMGDLCPDELDSHPMGRMLAMFFGEHNCLYKGIHSRVQTDKTWDCRGSPVSFLFD